MRKKIILLIFFLVTFFVVFSQESDSKNQVVEDHNNKENTISKADSKIAISVGFLHGGGSLAGADFEVLVGKTVGIQFGAGYLGFGAGINFHLKENNIRSSFISFQFMHQGIGRSTTQVLITPMFVYRAKKVFTASLGFGIRIAEGPAFSNTILNNDIPFMFTFAIGIYFPLK